MSKKLNEVPFEELTTGQSGIAIKEVYARKMSEIENKKGNKATATIWLNRAKNLEQLVPNLHDPLAVQNLLTNLSADNWTQNHVNHNRFSTSPALRQDQRIASFSLNGLANLNNNDSLPFAATQEQIDACLAEADRRYGTSSSRSKTEYIRTCLSRIPYKNIITEHIGKSGGVLFYTTIKNSQSVFNPAISAKENLQFNWVRDAAIATNLPTIQVQDVLAISVMEQFGETPANLEEGLRNFMAPIGSPNAQFIQPQTQTPPIIFPTGGSALPATSKEEQIINLIIKVTIIIVQLIQSFKKRNEEAKLREAAFAATPEVDDNFIMKCYDFNGNILPDCSVDGVASTKCFDPITGKEILCPGQESKSNGIAIVGGVLVAAGLVGLVMSNKKKKKKKQIKEAS